MVCMSMHLNYSVDSNTKYSNYMKLQLKDVITIKFDI